MARRVNSDHRWRGADELWSYPWDEWFDGNIWLLERGIDFLEPLERFRRRCYYVSQRRYLILRTQKEGNNLIVYARKPADLLREQDMADSLAQWATPPASSPQAPPPGRAPTPAPEPGR